MSRPSAAVAADDARCAAARLSSVRTLVGPRAGASPAPTSGPAPVKGLLRRRQERGQVGHLRLEPLGGAFRDPLQLRPEAAYGFRGFLVLLLRVGEMDPDFFERVL